MCRASVLRTRTCIASRQQIKQIKFYDHQITNEHTTKTSNTQRISRIAYPDHYKQMEDRQEALSNGPQSGLLNLLDVLEQRDVRKKPNV